MNSFPNPREAKEFLVRQILEEAQRERLPLSEIERKMLYFSETGWTLPDMMEVNSEFDRNYDQDQYEQKISALIRGAVKRVQKENRDEYVRWLDAISKLRREDHYILVMVDQAGISSRSAGISTRSPSDQLKLLGTALAIVAVILCAAFLAAKYDVDIDKYVPSRSAAAFAVWVSFAIIALAYIGSRLVFGAERIDALIMNLIEKLFVSSRKSD